MEMEYQDEVERMRARRRREGQAPGSGRRELEIIDFDDLDRRKRSSKAAGGRRERQEDEGPEVMVHYTRDQRSEDIVRQVRARRTKSVVYQEMDQGPEPISRRRRTKEPSAESMTGKGRKQESAVRQAVEEKRKKQKKKKRRRTFFGLLLLCVLLGGAFFYFRGAPKGKYWTVAVFGVDSRDGGLEKDNHSDVEMICVLNRETGEVRIVSVFRDTYLKVSSEGKYHKANQAYFDGGHKQAVEALEQNLDLKIDDYATFNWKAVADAITILGGIDLEISESEFAYINGFITETVNSTGLGSYQLDHPGMQHLDGVQSVAYARLRLMDTDYNRTARQRLVISLAMEKAKQADIGTLTTVLNTVLPQISTSIGVNDLLPLAKNVKKFHIGETGGFPFSRGETLIGKKDCVIPLTLESNVIQLHQFLYDDMEYQPSSAVREISARIAADSGMGDVAENAPEAKAGGSGSGSSGSGETQAPQTQPPVQEPSSETEETLPEESSLEEETSETGETGESRDSKETQDSGEIFTEPSEEGPGMMPGEEGSFGPSGAGEETDGIQPSTAFPQRPIESTAYVEPAGPGNPGV